MRTKKQIQTEMTNLKKQFAEVKGTPTEVYTRIVGYYRAVQNWNAGKKSEYADRVTFSSGEVERVEEIVTKSSDEVPISDELISMYKLFYKESCPGCPPVKNALKQTSMVGEEINADTKDGLAEAMLHQITPSQVARLIA